jgi:hypothetical protein
MRAALYWAPAPDDPLWDLGCRWLGRDAATGDACAQPDLPGIAALTQEPRHYGFHATLRPPMRLARSWASFQDAVLEVARGVAPFALPPLALADVHGFLALRESAPCPGLQALADRCITLTEPQRMAASAAELQRRRAGGLSARQDALLARWGYPYVMEEWFFHLTLTRRLERGEMAAARAAAAEFFAPALGVARWVEDICLFVEDGGAFRIVERFRLGRPAF